MSCTDHYQEEEEGKEEEEKNGEGIKYRKMKTYI
jgi:hypothetical protein